MKKKKVKKIKEVKASHSVLLKRAVKTFNAWIRARDAKKLNGRCYTCLNKGTEAGHFRHNNNATKFSEVFVNLQCGDCNRWKSGNLGVYALRLIEEHGLEKVRELERASHLPRRFKNAELEEIISKYSVDNY